MAISAKDLINKKQLIEDKKESQLEIEVPDVGTFLFRLPTINDYQDAQAKAKNRPDEAMENKYLIYTCCVEPALNDKELQDEFGCKEPIDIVDKLFMIGEISNIARILVEQAGFGDDYMRVVKKAKN